jgi:hypothetical protein
LQELVTGGVLREGINLTNAFLHSSSLIDKQTFGFPEDGANPDAFWWMATTAGVVILVEL